MPEPWRVTAGGLEVRARVTPRGGRDEIGAVETLADGASVLKVRVRAAPEDGANEAARRVLAGALGRPAGAAVLIAGHAARVKTLLVAGDGEALASRLRRHCAGEAE